MKYKKPELLNFKLSVNHGICQSGNSATGSEHEGTLCNSGAAAAGYSGSVPSCSVLGSQNSDDFWPSCNSGDAISGNSTACYGGVNAY